MLVRLTMKLAEVMDGVDLSRCAEGDIIELSDRDAALLIAEGWAISAVVVEKPSGAAENASCEIIAPLDIPAIAADATPRARKARAPGRSS